MAERVRAAFEAASQYVKDLPIRATVSAGVALSNDASDNLASLLKAADQALYCAKALGRNRVELSTEVTSPLSMNPKRAFSSAINSG
jgi:diguanylate cyclase (GGDEF)-like protein